MIKVLWGREWDPLFAADSTGDLVRIMNETPDGDFQTYKGESGGYIRDNFFGKSTATKLMVKDMSDDEIWNMKRGGHDYAKVYAAYHAATVRNGRPTVVLAQTVKGYGLGHNFEARNATHQMKKLKRRGPEDLPRPDAHPDHRRPDRVGRLRRAVLPPRARTPRRSSTCWSAAASSAAGCPSGATARSRSALPDTKLYAVAKKGSGKQMAATTMAFVRLLRDLMRDKGFGERVVPIIPDEARTFGMDSFFPSAMIYNPKGQNYTAVDRELFLAYKESTHGQLLHTGINEAGSMAAFTAAGTSYATHGEPMIPVYVFYSMFGFQRTGDAMWAAMDQMTRGLHHRRHRRSDHADRRGPAARRRPLAAAGLDQPGDEDLRPGVRVRDRAHRRGRSGADVRRGLRATATGCTT